MVHHQLYFATNLNALMGARSFQYFLSESLKSGLDRAVNRLEGSMHIYLRQVSETLGTSIEINTGLTWEEIESFGE